ncbi:MAG: PepSY domain-containing protein, partial [Pseudomonadota bacterium]
MQLAFGTIAVFAATVSAGPTLAQENASTAQLTLQEAANIALSVQPGTVAEAERDQFEGRAVADIEIVNEAGEEIEFKVDLESDEILNVWTDDDPTDDPEAASLEDMTFLIPGDLGGGWDTDARIIGNAFMAGGLADGLVFENREGGNGAVGLTYVIENADTLSSTLMLNTAQIVLRSLNGTYDVSYEELEPVVAPIADFAAFIVQPGSDIQTMADLLEVYQGDSTGFAIGGESGQLGLDHLIAAMVLEGAGEDSSFNYVQFDDPQTAFAALASGQVTAL